jgi:leucyl aminopeptidase
MQIKVKEGSLLKEKTDVILLEHFEDDKPFAGETKKVDSLMGGLLKRAFQNGEFTGKVFQKILFHNRGKMGPRKILWVGLGKKSKWNLELTRQVMGKVSVFLREQGVQNFSTKILGASTGENDVMASAQAMTEGIILSLYQFNVYHTEKKFGLKKMKQVTILEDLQPSKVRSGIQRGKIIAEATNFARDLGNHPSNVVTPSRLADEAGLMAKTYGLRCQVFNQKQMEKMGMGAILGVSKGSLEPPRFITLEYNQEKQKRAPIVIVGKSVTFDTGGISLKPSAGMEQMKGDMSGGAAVLGTLRAIAQLKLPVHVMGILPAAENMPSGHAIKPGDILKSYSGKTIEVLNTDAEGRLCLADALTYGSHLKPQAMIDLATLTGACVVALGEHAIGAMSRHPQLLEKLKKAGEQTGERVWELPLWEEYDEQIKSDMADLKNIGGKGAGTITAGLFLQHFVGNTPWVHLDIAGTAWVESGKPYCPKGSTGVGVRLLVDYLTQASEGKK